MDTEFDLTTDSPDTLAVDIDDIAPLHEELHADASGAADAATGFGGVGPAAKDAQMGPTQGLGLYMRALGHSKLLDAREEQVLGETLLQAREELTRALAGIPAVSERLTHAWASALAGKRPASGSRDVVRA